MRGERAIPSPPLTLPELVPSPSLERLTRSEAVRLFIERAIDVEPAFTVTNEIALVVAEICARLDGLPLAIELAAPWVRIFPPQALLARLSSRLDVLTDGARDLPERQQTLRAAIDWSYKLLSEPERTLLARLSVFAGGCSLQAVEEICAPDGRLDVLAGMWGLVEKSLVHQHGADEPRFSLLETIREFAGEKLEERDEAEAVRERHAAYFVTLAEHANAQLRGEQTRLWLDRLDAETGNLRAVRDWSLSSPSPNIALRLARALWLFWNDRHRWAESQSGWNRLWRTRARRTPVSALMRWADSRPRGYRPSERNCSWRRVFGSMCRQGTGTVRGSHD